MLRSISHWAPTVCIQVPTLLTSTAIHNVRKIVIRSGAQADAAVSGIRWLFGLASLVVDGREVVVAVPGGDGLVQSPAYGEQQRGGG